MISWPDAVDLVFQTFAAKEEEGECVGLYVLDQHRLDCALNALGTPLQATDPKIVEIASKLPKVQQEQFKSIAEKSLRWHLLSCINEETFVNDLMGKYLPEKVGDLLRLDRSSIANIFTNQDFISAATDQVFACLQRRTRIAIATIAISKHPSADEVWADSLVLGRTSYRAKTTSDDRPARRISCFVPEKFKIDGRFFADVGSSHHHSTTLHEHLGPADASILRGILREHTVSTEPFVSSSHGVFTTPLLELARLLGDDDGRHGRRSAWNYLRERAAATSGDSDSGDLNGPTRTELDRLQLDFEALREAAAAALAAAGRFPGEAGDSYAEALVDVEIACDDSDAAAAATEQFAAALGQIEADWSQALTPSADGAGPAAAAGRGLAIVAPPAARGAAAAAVFALPHPLAGGPAAAASDDDVGAQLRRSICAALGVANDRVRVAPLGTRAYTYCEHVDSASLRRALLASDRTLDQFAAAAAAAAAAAITTTSSGGGGAAARRRPGEKPRTREECVHALAQVTRRHFVRETKYPAALHLHLYLFYCISITHTAGAGLRPGDGGVAAGGPVPPAGPAAAGAGGAHGAPGGGGGGAAPGGGGRGAPLHRPDVPSAILRQSDSECMLVVVYWSQVPRNGS
jgi:hypothetical protein